MLCYVMLYYVILYCRGVESIVDIGLDLVVCMYPCIYVSYLLFHYLFPSKSNSKSNSNSNVAYRVVQHFLDWNPSGNQNRNEETLQAFIDGHRWADNGGTTEIDATKVAPHLDCYWVVLCSQLMNRLVPKCQAGDEDAAVVLSFLSLGIRSTRQVPWFTNGNNCNQIRTQCRNSYMHSTPFRTSI
jgi:hypothetical protein